MAGGREFPLICWWPAATLISVAMRPPVTGFFGRNDWKAVVFGARQTGSASMAQRPTGNGQMAGVPLRFYFYVGRHFVFCAFPVVWCVEQFSTLTAQFPLLFPLFSLRNAFGRV